MVTLISEYVRPLTFQPTLLTVLVFLVITQLTNAFNTSV